MSNGRTTISHREFIADISGSPAYASTSYAVNPGDSVTFPWLAAIARNYESYKFRSLTFEYRTTASSITKGSVMMALDYDASDAPPADKCKLMAYAGASRSAAWDENNFRARPADLTKFAKERYVRIPGLTIVDIKTYDVANLFIATQGMEDSLEVGELYVNYTVELQTPQLGDIPPSSATTTVSNGGTPDNTFLGPQPTIDETNILDLEISTVATQNDTLTFTAQVGAVYQINTFCNGTTLVVPGLNVISGATQNSTFNSLSNPATSSYYGVNVTATEKTIVLRYPSQTSTEVTLSAVSVTLQPSFP